MNLYLPLKTTAARLLLAISVPAGFLLVVKTGSVLLGRHFAVIDLFIAALTIIIVAAGTVIARPRRISAS